MYSPVYISFLFLYFIWHCLSILVNRMINFRKYEHFTGIKSRISFESTTLRWAPSIAVLNKRSILVQLWHIRSQFVTSKTHIFSRLLICYSFAKLCGCRLHRTSIVRITLRKLGWVIPNGNNQDNTRFLSELWINIAIHSCKWKCEMLQLFNWLATWR